LYFFSPEMRNEFMEDGKFHQLINFTASLHVSPAQGAMDGVAERILSPKVWKRNLYTLSVGNGNLNLNTRLDIDGGDLLHDLGGGVQVNHSLMDPHLELVPGLGDLPQGVLRVVMRRVLVGMRTGPLSLAP
jgi:hypothetical protein